MKKSGFVAPSKRGAQETAAVRAPGERLKAFIQERLEKADGGARSFSQLARILGVTRQQLDVALLRPHWTGIPAATLAAALGVTVEELYELKPNIPRPPRGRPRGKTNPNNGATLPRGPGELARLVAAGLSLETEFTFRGETHPLSFYLTHYR